MMQHSMNAVVPVSINISWSGAAAKGPITGSNQCFCYVDGIAVLRPGNVVEITARSRRVIVVSTSRRETSEATDDCRGAGGRRRRNWRLVGVLPWPVLSRLCSRARAAVVQQDSDRRVERQDPRP